MYLFLMHGKNQFGLLHIMRIRTAAEDQEEAKQKLDIKACFDIAHNFSIETEINWMESIRLYRESRKNLIKDSTWRII